MSSLLSLAHAKFSLGRGYHPFVTQLTEFDKEMWQHFVGHSYKEGTLVRRKECLQPFVFTSPFVCKCMCQAENRLFPPCMWIPDSELRSSDLVACVPPISAIFPAPYTLTFAFHFATTCSLPPTLILPAHKLFCLLLT